MTASTDHGRWADALGAYLLQALPEHERLGFEAHLAACETCRRDLADLRVAADALPASAQQLEAPPELRDRIMAVVRSEAELLQAAGARADVAEPRAADRHPRRVRFGLRPALALAAVLAIGVIAGAVLRDGAGPNERTVLAKVEVPGASARLIIRPEHSTLVARNLPRPQPGRVYQVWLKRPRAAPEPTDALFTVRNDGSASVDVPGSLDGVENVLVTSEPDGGSPAPTRPPIISAVPA